MPFKNMSRARPRMVPEILLLSGTSPFGRLFRCSSDGARSVAFPVPWEAGSTLRQVASGQVTEAVNGAGNGRRTGCPSFSGSPRFTYPTWNLEPSSQHLHLIPRDRLPGREG